MTKELIIGIVVGLIANAIGLFLTTQVLGNGDSFTQVIQAAYNEGFFRKIN